MSECISQYTVELKKNLRCSGKARDRLMSGFDASLKSFLEDTPAPEMDEICAAFGPPKEMAELLMSNITPVEATQYRRKCTLLRIAAGLAASLVLLSAIYIFFFKEQSVTYDNNVEIDNSYASASSFVVDGLQSVD